MRETCQVDLLVGAKDKNSPPTVVATRIFSDFKNCRILDATLNGSRLEVRLLLPEVPGGYGDLAGLRSLVQGGLIGKGVVLAAVHGLREATSMEILDRTLSRRKEMR